MEKKKQIQYLISKHQKASAFSNSLISSLPEIYLPLKHFLPDFVLVCFASVDYTVCQSLNRKNIRFTGVLQNQNSFHIENKELNLNIENTLKQTWIGNHLLDLGTAV